MKRPTWQWLVVATAGLIAPGCVERTARIQTDPPGALITVNDEEIGVSPVKFHFLWYGNYDIIIRKPGYNTLKTSYHLDPPWYQWPPFDLITDALIPQTIRDEHTIPTFVLERADPPAIDDVVQRAAELRDRALYQSPSGPHP